MSGTIEEVIQPPETNRKYRIKYFYMKFGAPKHLKEL